MERYDLSVHNGEDIRQEILFKDGSGVVIDLTGAIGRSQIRRAPGAEELIEEFVVTVDGAAGKVTLGMTGAESGLIDPGTYAWDLFLEQGGVSTCYVGGAFLVIPSVTG